LIKAATSGEGSLDKYLQWRPVKTSRRLRRILVHVQKEFLEEFDRETSGLYASRNEAIRAGMILVLETLKNKRTPKVQHRPDNNI